VPDRAEFHPIRFIPDPKEDLMGAPASGSSGRRQRTAKREAPDRKIAQTWRGLAGQLRWLASFIDGHQHELLARRLRGPRQCRA
jgi:hypothetical protein